MGECIDTPCGSRTILCQKKRAIMHIMVYCKIYLSGFCLFWFEPSTVLLRAYSQLFVQGSLLTGIRSAGNRQCKPHAKQILYPLYCSSVLLVIVVLIFNDSYKLLCNLLLYHLEAHFKLEGELLQINLATNQDNVSRTHRV